MSPVSRQPRRRSPHAPEVIFAIIADPRQHPRIDGSGTVKGIVKGPDKLSLGASFGMNMKQGAPYKITSKVVEYDEGRLIAWQHPLGHIWRYELAPVDGDATSTRVTESFDYSKVGGVKAAFLKAGGFPKKNKKGIEQTLVRLDAAALQDASAADA